MPKSAAPVLDMDAVRAWAVAGGLRVDPDGTVDPGHVRAYVKLMRRKAEVEAARV